MIFTFVITLFLAAVLQLFLPWWSVVIAAFLAGFFSSTTAFRTFSACFLSIATLWFGFMIVISIFGSTVVLPKLTTLFSLPHYILIFPIAILIGALPAGLSGLSAYYFRDAMKSDTY